MTVPYVQVQVFGHALTALKLTKQQNGAQDIKRIKQEGPGIADVILTYKEKKAKPARNIEVGEDGVEEEVEEIVKGYVPLEARFAI